MVEAAPRLGGGRRVTETGALDGSRPAVSGLHDLGFRLIPATRGDRTDIHRRGGTSDNWLGLPR